MQHLDDACSLKMSNSENETPNYVVLKTTLPIVEPRSNGVININFDAIGVPTASPSPRQVVSKGVPQTKPRQSVQPLLQPRAATGTAFSASGTAPVADTFVLSSSSPPRREQPQDHAKISYTSVVYGSKEHDEMMARDSVYSHMKQAMENRAKDRARASLTAGKPSSAKHSRKASASATVIASRNPRDWDVEQDVALLTEVVEGDIFLMIKLKGAKAETPQSVRRSKGIPYGYTGLYWQAIIDNLESAHHKILCDKTGSSVPLFPLALKVDYVKTRFDTLVSMRASKAERTKAKAGKSNADDWVTGQGDDSEEEDKADGEAPTVQEKDKKNLETRDSLLDAYLAQVRAFGETSAAVESEEVGFVSANGGSKRPKSGQQNEGEDDDMIEANANGGKKQSKLPKLPRVTHAEHCQSQAIDHQSRVSSGFEALALSQKPDTPEQFTAKMQSGAIAVSSVIASTITGAMQAWAEVKKGERTCVKSTGHEFATVEGTAPPIIICKHCGLRP
jgi:hypothetical protein